MNLPTTFVAEPHDSLLWKNRHAGSLSITARRSEDSSAHKPLKRVCEFVDTLDDASRGVRASQDTREIVRHMDKKLHVGSLPR